MTSKGLGKIKQLKAIIRTIAYAIRKLHFFLPTLEEDEGEVEEEETEKEKEEEDEDEEEGRRRGKKKNQKKKKKTKIKKLMEILRCIAGST
ncbi:hypothetical protein M8J77_009251 [Diaphorina citri]|nr:hypothetical protein M8J77_009251 [Diaphorina citri]